MDYQDKYDELPDVGFGPPEFIPDSTPIDRTDPLAVADRMADLELEEKLNAIENEAEVHATLAINAALDADVHARSNRQIIFSDGTVAIAQIGKQITYEIVQGESALGTLEYRAAYINEEAAIVLAALLRGYRIAQNKVAHLSKSLDSADRAVLNAIDDMADPFEFPL
jgi:hypothetical protein